MNNNAAFPTSSDPRTAGNHAQRPSYSEDSVRHWLHNLASGMQSAGHSMLLLEQLQPGMLPRRREKIIYIFVTRCLAGLFVGLAGGALQHGLYIGSGAMEPGSAAAWGFAAGFATAIAATTQLGKRILTRVPITSPMGLHIFRGVLGTVVAGIGVAIGEFLFRWLFFHQIGIVVLTLDQLVLMGFIAVLTGLLGTRTMGRAFTADIESIETLGMSWKDAMTGIIAGGVVSFLLSLVYVYFISTTEVPTLASLFQTLSPAQSTPSDAADQRTSFDRAFQSSVITIVGIVIGGLFHGMIPQTRKHKSSPNQGITLTIYYCLRFGAGLGLFAGALWGICIYRIHDRLPKINASGTKFSDFLQEGIRHLPISESAQAGLTVALFGGVGVFIVAGIWFGALDVMRHYVLRLMLAAFGYLPLRLKTFINYVERDLTFVERVGGGYRFIHRYLLEYFATAPVGETGANGSSDTEMVRLRRLRS